MRNNYAWTAILIICIFLYSCQRKADYAKSSPSNTTQSKADSSVPVIKETAQNEFDSMLMEKGIDSDSPASSSSQVFLIFGCIERGIPVDSVRKCIGSPDSVTPTTVDEARTGGEVKDWLFSERGIRITFLSGSTESAEQVYSYWITHPCSLKTEKGIGIGSSSEEVYSAYDKLIDKEYSDESRKIIIGSIYEGTQFFLKDSIVTKILRWTRG